MKKIALKIALLLLVATTLIVKSVSTAQNLLSPENKIPQSELESTAGLVIVCAIGGILFTFLAFCLIKHNRKVKQTEKEEQFSNSEEQLVVA